MKEYQFEKFIPDRKPRVTDISRLGVGDIFHCNRRSKKCDRWPAIKYTLKRLLATGKTYSVSIDEFEIAVRRDS